LSGTATALPQGSSQLACFPYSIKGFEGFASFVTKNNKQYGNNKRNL
jgi:hypothetical protein